MRSNQEGKRRLIIIVILIVAVALLVGIVFFKHAREKHRYLPVINPHPKQFITISGYIDKNLTGEFLFSYATHNKECETSPLVTGASISRIKTLRYLIKPNNKDKFTLIIPADKFLTGFCNWRIESIGLNLHLQSNSKYNYEDYPVYFYKKTEYKPIKIIYSCKQVPETDPTSFQKTNMACKNNISDRSIDAPYSIQHLYFELNYQN